MVFVTGDIHAMPYDRFSVKAFPEQKHLTKNDVVIICGDFGVWHDSAEERAWLCNMGERGFTTCFCDGNHENFDRLNSDEFEVVDFCGGKAQKIRDSIYHLLRGEIYTINGYRFFVMGGASSHDIKDGVLDLANYENYDAFKRVYKRMTRQNKIFRVNHVSWWKEELPSGEEMATAISNLEHVNFEIDYVISHCAPTSIMYKLGYNDSDVATDFLQVVKQRCKFKHWFFGHYHRDENVDDWFTAVYRKIIKLEG